MMIMKGEFCCGKEKKDSLSKDNYGSCLDDDYCDTRHFNHDCYFFRNGILIFLLLSWLH